MTKDRDFLTQSQPEGNYKEIMGQSAQKWENECDRVFIPSTRPQIKNLGNQHYKVRFRGLGNITVVMPDITLVMFAARNCKLGNLGIEDKGKF